MYQLPIFQTKGSPRAGMTGYLLRIPVPSQKFRSWVSGQSGVMERFRVSPGVARRHAALHTKTGSSTGRSCGAQRCPQRLWAPYVLFHSHCHPGGGR